jgi:hypothetical protein
MHRLGSRSWQFGHGDMGYLHTALFVRDAVRLPVPPSAGVPPRLTGDVPDCGGVLPPGERDEAARQWAAWWHRLVGQAVREARQRTAPLPAGTAPDDFEAVIRHRFAGRHDVFDPPDFGSLAGTPGLRSAATAALELSRRWSQSQPDRTGGPEMFAMQLVRDAAQSTAAELGVPVGELSGYAHVLDVQGVWSYLAGPGCALCSVAAARDPVAASRLLGDVFSRGHSRGAGS